MARLFIVVAWLLSSLAHADIIVDWNQHAQATLVAAGPATSNNPIAMARALAIMHVAMFDAIDACHPAYSHHLTTLPASPDASPQAAAAAAARQLLAQRKYDGTVGTPDTYRPFTAPGTYVPTALPVVSNVALRKPFALQRIAQFRPPPPSLGSATWVRDFNETREWGAANSVVRSAWQTETARFCEQLGTPAWNQVARTLSARQSVALAERARVFALLNVAMFDAYLAVFDAKYYYHFWRPVTAIRNGDRDGNDATARDPAWRPLIETPPPGSYSPRRLAQRRPHRSS